MATGSFYQTLKELLIFILYRVFREYKGRVRSPVYHLNNVTVTQKQHRGKS